MTAWLEFETGEQLARAVAALVEMRLNDVRPDDDAWSFNVPDLLADDGGEDEVPREALIEKYGDLELFDLEVTVSPFHDFVLVQTKDGKTLLNQGVLEAEFATVFVQNVVARKFHHPTRRD